MPESKLKLDPSSLYNTTNVPAYMPTPTQQTAQNRLLNDWILARLVCNRQYNYFNGQNLYDVIDDWTMRWNGYIQPLSVLDETNSNIFLNFTRNLIISYLSKVAMKSMEPKILAVNKKTNIANQTFADLLKDLNRYSLQNEDADSKFLKTALEATVKGTAIVYEGYRKTTTKRKTPVAWDTETGVVKTIDMDRVDFDDCFQELCRLEDVYISNPWTTDIQEQPYLIWKKTTTYQEAFKEFGHYGPWKYVTPGSYRLLAEPTSFYSQELYNELQPNQVQVIRYYNRKENLHIVMINNVILYNGPIPFIHSDYPFAKYIYEPFGNDFFWGAGAPFKFMGEQDIANSQINMMTDKTFGSLLPYGLSSDLDDMIEDDTLAPNKIRKVGDINKWKFATLPGVESGESAQFQLMMNLIRQNSGIDTSASMFGSTSGRLTARQALLQQQEAVQKLQYSMNFLEQGERDRTELRLKNIMQFYSIPKIEKITGADGKTYESLVYKNIVLHDTTLSDGKKGTKIIKIVDEEMMDPNERMKLEEELSVQEAMGEMQGTPTEAVAIPVSMFENFDLKVQIVKNSSYQKNQALDQAAAMDYAKWRVSMIPLGLATDMNELGKYVDETYNLDTDRFTPKTGGVPGGPPSAPAVGGIPPPGMPPAPGAAPPPGGAPKALAPAGPAKPGPSTLDQLKPLA